MNYGFVKIASAIPSVRVANCQFNIEQIESMVVQAEGRGVEIICFPELSITSYTCQDLFQQQLLIDEAEMALIHLMNFSRSLDIISIVGLLQLDVDSVMRILESLPITSPALSSSAGSKFPWFKDSCSAHPPAPLVWRYAKTYGHQCPPVHHLPCMEPTSYSI